VNNSTHEPAELPHALQQLPEIWRCLAGKSPALFLDYDGTLTPIVARPELAVLDTRTRSVLQALAHRCTVAIVSGRDRLEVERLVALDNVIYAGSHGFDIRGPGNLRLEYGNATDFLPALDAAERKLKDALSGINGAIVERKRFAIAVHYRLVAQERVPAIAAAVDATRQTCHGLRKTGGKMILELRPDLPWDKGRAVLWLLDVLGLGSARAVPVYVGDDETDEDAFMALHTCGLGIRVGGHASHSTARFRLDHPGETGDFLRVLLALMEKAT